MTKILELIKESGGLPIALLALSGTLFVLYVVTIAVIVSWPRGRGR